MKNRNPFVTVILLFLIGLGVISALVWGNYRFTMANPGGSGFAQFYYPTRQYLLNGTSPYSAEGGQQLIEPGNPEVSSIFWNNEKNIATYPMYAVIPFIPLALIEDFAFARAIWMALLELALIASCMVGLKLIRWKLGNLGLTVFLFLSVFWFFAIQSIVDGNLAAIISIFVVGAIQAMRESQEEFAGILFGLTTFSLDMSWAFLIFILVWGITRRKYKILGWMLASIILLSGIGLLLIPDWPVQLIRVLIETNYFRTGYTIHSALVHLLPAAGQRLGIALSIFFGVLCLLEWFVNRKSEFNAFLWKASLTICITPLLGLPFNPAALLAIFPVFLVVLLAFNTRWVKGGGQGLIVVGIGYFLVFWGLALGPLRNLTQNSQISILTISLLFFSILLLYWVRWWVIRPSSVWVDQIKGDDI